jgi:hypothetical protein
LQCVTSAFNLRRFHEIGEVSATLKIGALDKIAWSGQKGGSLTDLFQPQAVLAAAYAQFPQRFMRGEPMVKGAPNAAWIYPPVAPNLP